jgi:hypothetical protein
MKDNAILSTVASTPAILGSGLQWFGAHVPQITMYLTFIWTGANVLLLGLKFAKWVRSK